jgi:hypothetical protein
VQCGRIGAEGGVSSSPKQLFLKVITLLANVNSTSGFVSLPAQTIGTTAVTTFLVPPSTALYQGLPSPVFSAGAGLYLALDPDYQSSNPNAASPTYVNSSVDGRQFRIRIVGLTTVSASSTFQVSLYQGTSSTVTSDTLIAISASYTITTASSVNWVFETNLLWDSTTSHLNGWFFSDVNNTFTGAAAITAITNLTVTQLQFIGGVTFGTSNSANQVVVKEYLVEKV